MRRIEKYCYMRRANPVFGVLATVLIVAVMLLIAYWGVALLDSDYAAAACKDAQTRYSRGSGIRRLLACEIPRPVSMLILLGAALFCFWNMWQVLVCLLLNRPKFLFDDYGVAALVARPTLLSGQNWHEFSWEDIEAVEERTFSRVNFIVLRFKSLQDPLPAKRREHGLAYRDVRSDYYLTFFHLFSHKRPDLAEQLDRLVRQAVNGKPPSAKFNALFSKPAAPAPPPLR
jgi:hypothetical protein